MKGVFISLEGMEGSGKTTQARLLEGALASRGIGCVFTREPGGTVISQKIREILLAPEHGGMDHMTELLLYAASRRQHLVEVISPALEKGLVVVTDRFSDSTLAYQGHARGMALALIKSLDEMVTGGLRPNLTILLDLDTGAGLARNRRGNSLDRLEREDYEFHQRVREGFLSIQREEPERVRLVPTSGSVPETHKAVMGLVLECLGRRGY